jgi:hypothetical protein
MKTFPRVLKTSLWLAVLQLGLFLCQPLPAAVTFTNTPSVVSNTYNGTISLQIGGLTNTEKVVVQKFLDLNTNGVIDGTDWLVQQFTLQDGTNFVIGGVTNFNVPGDLNATTGAITATLNFKNGDFVQNIIGKYLYKLSSPAGHFTPITNSFIVTNFPYAQKFTGNVVSNSTSTTLPNAVVLLFPPPRPGNNGPGGTPLAGVVANNAGSYTVQAPPGTYQLLSFRSNFVANMNTAPVLTLAASQTITTNVSLTNATSSISGTNFEAGNSSIRLPGVMVSAMSTNGLLGICFSDTNGIFNVRVTAGTWGINVDDMALIVHGYLGIQDGTNATAGTTGVRLPVPKATTLIYGSVKDNLGNPLVGIDVYANDNNDNLYQTDGYTDTSGNYVVGVLGGLGSNDPWWIQISSDTSPTNYVFSQPDFGSNGGTNISANTAAQINFTALLATNHISGYVKDNNGANFVGVGVWASFNSNGTNYQNYVDTDTNGNYSLNVANGNWTVGVNSGGGGDSLPGNYLCSVNQSVVISNNNAVVNFTALLATNHISGYVKDNHGTNIVGVGVNANATINGTDYQTYADTDDNGDYSLNVANGSWSVSVNCNGGNDSLDNILGFGTYVCPNSQSATISGNDATNNFIVQPCDGISITTPSPLPVGEADVYYDQFIQASSCSGNYNWLQIGGSLPGNLNLSTNGQYYELSGNPTNSGTFTFTVQISDGVNTTDKQFSLTISNALQVATTSLPNGTNGSAYSQQLQAAAGVPFDWASRYSWIVLSGSLPANLTLATNGLLSGTLTTSGAFNFTVEVADSLGGIYDQPLSLTINASVPSAVILTAPTWLGSGEFIFTFNSRASVDYTIQASIDLETWIPVLTFSGADGPVTIIDPNATGTGQRFYRVKIEP